LVTRRNSDNIRSCIAIHIDDDGVETHTEEKSGKSLSEAMNKLLERSEQMVDGRCIDPDDDDEDEGVYIDYEML
jgi:predicted CopG family antitoxin